MNRAVTLVPTISIYPDRVNFFHTFEWYPGKPGRKYDEEGNPIKRVKWEHLVNSERSAMGVVSKIAHRKMTKALDYLLFMANPKKVTTQWNGKKFAFRVAFITLTLPSKQIHSDNEIKKECLNQFLIEIKKLHNVKNYIWRAEKQENGNIHFHLVLDRFIPFQSIRDRWNRIVEKLGYVSRYREEQLLWHREGFKVRTNLLPTWSREKQYKAYQRGAKTHWNSPNSTDVHSIRKIQNLKHYMMKYLTKQDERALEQKETGEIMPIVEGRIWGCNAELSKAKPITLPVDSVIDEEMKILTTEGACRSYKGDYFEVFYIKFEQIAKHPQFTMFKEFTDWCINHFGYQGGLFLSQ